MSKKNRQPAVAGQFYPSDRGELRIIIDNYLKEAKIPPHHFKSPLPPLSRGNPQGGIEWAKALIVPHAGYVFSGLVAAHAYKAIQDRKIETVVIICNSHTAYFDGIAVDDSLFWRTPLGEVEVDKKLAEKFAELDGDIKFNSEAHKAEHSLEVQLPFLQMVLQDGFKIVPLLFGNAKRDGYKKLAVALAKNLGDDDLVVISSDMSHYPSYEDANKIDNETLKIIRKGGIEELEAHIAEVENKNIPNEQTLLCGIDGVKTIMELANILGWRAEILKYANSGDAPVGDPTSLKLRGASKESVVGYGAVVFAESQKLEVRSKNFKELSSEASELSSVLNCEQQRVLLNIAKIAVESYIKTGKVSEFEINDERLNWKEGVFVTLKRDGKLRGCIGQIIPGDKPLWQVARDMAIAAAAEDDRFSPVSAAELGDLEYEISVLSAPQKITNWQDIELGKHGVIIKKGLRGGVFLPQVANETGWSKEEFLAQLCYQKAGLSADCYKDKDVEISVFTAQVF